MTPDVFAYGVGSFDPTPNGVLLWTHTDRPGPVRWVVAADVDMSDIVTSGSAEPGPSGAVIVDVGGLDPATTYFYQFDQSGQRSMPGRTRTLPAGAVTSFRLGVASCAQYSTAPLGVYRAMADHELDLVLHLGDYIYESATASSGRRVDEVETAVTLDDYRARYAQLRSDPDLQMLHARHPMVAIWDDHDLADNSWRTGAKAHDPDEHGDWDARVDAATTARNEWVPIRHRDPERPRRTWRHLDIGDLATLVLLDTRYEGRDPHAGDDGARPRDDPDRSLLGDDQRSFVADQLGRSDHRWNLLASGIVVNDMTLPLPGGFDPPGDPLPNGYTFVDGRFVSDDGWDGFVAERALLADRIAASPASTVIVSGDVHSSWAFDGPLRPDGYPVAVEAVCPAVSSAAMGRANVPVVNRLLDVAVRQLDAVVWANVTERGHLILDITPARIQVDWWKVDPYGRDPSSSATCLRSLVVDHGVAPPHFEDADGPLPPLLPRPALPVSLPRPDDLPTLRAARVRRLLTKAGPVVALGVTVVAYARHRRRR